jgi:hypothetical protein
MIRGRHARVCAHAPLLLLLLLLLVSPYAKKKNPHP